jgi:predicted enzyme related to lactoylglutathione lyase
MPEPDRVMAERFHAIVERTAPSLAPRLWYEMPAYAKDGKVLCFFQSAQGGNGDHGPSTVWRMSRSGAIPMDNVHKLVTSYCIKGVSTVVYPVSDLSRAKALFSRLLGVEPAYDDSRYVGFTAPEGDDPVPLLGLDPNGKRRGMTGATPFWEVDDIEAAVASLTESGATLVEDVHDVGDGGLVAILADADGNMIGLDQAP